MRLLGYLIVVIVGLAVIGYFRGWFAVSTTHAAGRDEVTVAVDRDRAEADAKAASAKLGQLTAKAVAAVKSLGTKVSAVESTLEGTLTAVDQAARDLTVTAGGEAFALHVPTGIPVTRNGAAAGFEQLQPTKRVKLAFRHAGEDRYLTRIEILD